MIDLGLPCNHIFGVPETMVDVTSSAKRKKTTSRPPRRNVWNSVLTASLTLAALTAFHHLAREMAFEGKTERHLMKNGKFDGFRFNYDTPGNPFFRPQLAEKLHFCPSTRVNGKNSSSSSGFNIPFQCGGDVYDDFCKRLDHFASNTRQHGTTWGRRPNPLPSGTTVLVFGNSHTRQVAHEWFCQYQQSIDSVEQYTPEVAVVRFDNDSTLISVTNSPVVYSRMWPSLLETALGRTFQSLDAIVLGKFNDFEDSVNTKFMETMMNLSSGVEGADFKNIAPPTLEDLAKVYSGPIVCVGMFATFPSAKRALEEFYMTKTKLETSGDRTNVRIIDGRKYIPILGECGNDIRGDVPGEVGTCNEGEVPGMRHATLMHRCVGPCGGHPSLMAWDVIEVLRQLIVSSTS